MISGSAGALISRTVLVCAFAIVTFGPASAMAWSRDEDSIRAVLTSYLTGHATGDPSHMRKAFLRTAHIEGLRNGVFVSWTLEEYCSLFNGKPAADEESHRRTIDTIDISGTAASARATLVHGSTTLTDYFVLLKVNGEWKIANKVYSAQATK